MNILIIGATSAIATATARIYAGRGARIYLLARDTQALSVLAKDLNVRGAQVDYKPIEANDFQTHPRLINAAFKTLGTVDVVLIAHGSLPNQSLCAADFNVAQQQINTNAISVISMLTHIANKMATQGSGTIAVITSVAGDRGRQSNYVYGAAKAMVSVFLQGLRGRLHSAGVKVVDIKPGFVDTPMTAGIKKGLLWAQPETIAKGIIRAIDKNKTSVYLPWFWIGIMAIIRMIPEFVFKKIKL